MASGVALVATELATNLVKHAKERRSCSSRRRRDGRRGIEISSRSTGAGHGQRRPAMRDGYSTAGSSGTGLGALSRLVGSFDLHSPPGGGTVVAARYWLARSEEAGGRGRGPHRRVLAMAFAGEPVSGDAWAWHGHAAERARSCSSTVSATAWARRRRPAAPWRFRRCPMAPRATSLDVIHDGLRDTRGAAGAVADLDLRQGVSHCAGIGNIAGGRDCDGATRHMVSSNGTLGHRGQASVAFDYPFPKAPCS